MKWQGEELHEFFSYEDKHAFGKIRKAETLALGDCGLRYSQSVAFARVAGRDPAPVLRHFSERDVAVEIRERGGDLAGLARANWAPVYFDDRCYAHSRA